MPKLAGATATQYTEWKTKAKSYFQTNGLAEVVLTDPAKSLPHAFKIDNKTRSIHIIKSLWQRLHGKAIGAIRTAVEPIVGTSFFDEIELEQTECVTQEVRCSGWTNSNWRTPTICGLNYK